MNSSPDSRNLCYRCLKAEVMCYCAELRPFASDPRFAILLHPKEARKAINTGRMAHLSMSNSWLIEDETFDQNPKFQALLANPKQRLLLLFPGEDATDIENLTREPGIEDVFVILDATWAMAKKMYQRSESLKSLPQVMFTPKKPSGFSIRKQPKVECYSTIETVHHILEVFGRNELAERENLLHIFNKMVSEQLRYERENGNSR